MAQFCATNLFDFQHNCSKFFVSFMGICKALKPEHPPQEDHLPHRTWENTNGRSEFEEVRAALLCAVPDPYKN